MRPKLHLLTGPTAVGKTEWALRWAERSDAEIISCDSLLFYRGMDVGTAKPSAGERRRVPHHLIDICEVSQPMDVATFVRRARRAAETILSHGRRVLVVGGSGFYLKSFLASVADDIDVPRAIRDEVATLAPEAALARLRERNPAGLGTLDTANPRRVARALERSLASNRTIAELAAEFAARPSSFSDFEIALTRLERNSHELESRIEARVAAMLQDGLVDEVRRLRELGLEGNPSAARAIGYREVLAMFRGALRESDLAGEIARDTRALVKKQRTWFRTQLPPHRTLDAACVQSPAELFDLPSKEGRCAPN